MRWLLLGLFWVVGCAAPRERPSLPVSPAEKSPTPALTSASAPSPAFVLPTSFSPSGNSVVYWKEQAVATVASLADCHLIAKVAESPEHVARSDSSYYGTPSLPNDDELVFTYPNPDTGGFLGERRALSSGAVLGSSPAHERFSTPLGVAYFDVRGTTDALLPEHAELVLEGSGATPRRIKLLPTFGGIEWLRLSVLGTVGSTLVVHLQGAMGALSVQRVGAIELKSGTVKVAPTLVATTGSVAFAKNRVALVQEDDSPVFVYELPSLRRLSVTREQGFTEQRYEDFSLGQPYSCVALSPDARVVAAYRNSSSDSTTLRWFDAGSGKRLGELEGPRFSSAELCRLSFTADGQKLVLATDKGSVFVASLADAKVLFSFSWGGCGYNGHDLTCSGGSALSADARFFAAIDATEDRLRFVELESGKAHDLGRVPATDISFDPTSRYLVVAGRVWSTSLLRSPCALP